MKVELKIDKNYKTPLCVIYTDQITEEIKSYITKLSCTTQNTVTGKSFSEKLRNLALFYKKFNDFLATKDEQKDYGIFNNQEIGLKVEDGEMCSVKYIHLMPVLRFKEDLVKHYGKEMANDFFEKMLPVWYESMKDSF